MQKESRPKPAPPTIVLMSLRPAIPRRVALQQSPPPLRRTGIIVAQKRIWSEAKIIKRQVSTLCVSQPRGSPQDGVATPHSRLFGDHPDRGIECCRSTTT